MSLFIFFILSLSVGAFAQGNKSFGRLGIGTGLHDSPSQSFFIEYGKLFRHIEGGVKFTYYNTFPLRSENRNVAFKENEYGSELLYYTYSKQGNYSGKKYLSLTFNVGYNLFSLFSDKHNFTPFVALGFGSLMQVENFFGKDNTILEYRYTFADMEWGFGARYEYTLSSKIRLGAYYEYYNHLERDMLGLNITRVF